VEVAVAGDDADLQVAVTDSGAGLAEGDSAVVFTDGWTTQVHDRHRHGLGLALARQTARRHAGDVEVLAGAGPDHGAVFVATLRGVVVAPASRVRA
jgi:two-component system CitB family sensor kinase